MNALRSSLRFCECPLRQHLQKHPQGFRFRGIYLATQI